MQALLDQICIGVHAQPLPDYHCNNGVWMRLFLDADAAEMKVVLRNADRQGFISYAENTLEDNVYVTLQNGKTMLHVYYIPAERKLRVIADSFTVPFAAVRQPYTRRCNTTVWMIETDHTYIDCGMCFVVQCADGSFFVIDSGHYLQLNDHKRLYRFLRERTPSGENVVISGWFITHAHDDHVCKCMDFLKENYSDVVIEYYYYNTTDPDGRDCAGWNEWNRAIMRQFDEAAESSGIPIVKLHSGQHFYVRNLSIDVLCTHEDVYPESLENYNDSSTVLMIEADGSRICIPGDAGMMESDCMTTRFTEKTLCCDVMQQSHHGHFGTSVRFYELADARLLLFPNTQIIFDQDLPMYEANRVAIERANAYHISSNGTVEVPLPYDPQTVRVLPDETFENFDRIQALWGYTYTPERKQQLFDDFLKRSGLPPMSEIKG